MLIAAMPFLIVLLEHIDDHFEICDAFVSETKTQQLSYPISELISKRAVASQTQLHSKSLKLSGNDY